MLLKHLGSTISDIILKSQQRLAILIPGAQKTNMKLREVKECIQDATASVTQAGFKGQCVWFSTCTLRNGMLGLPCGPVVKNLPAKAVDTDLIPGLGRSHLSRGN